MATIVTVIFLFGLVMCFVCWCTDNKEVAAVILTIIALCVGSYLLIYQYPKFLCEQRVEPSGYQCMYDFFAGCQINVKGQWVPYDKWRVIE